MEGVKRKLKLGIFISGRGSNMRSIVEACAHPDFPAEVCFVLSNRPDAPGLNFARDQNIPAFVVDHTQYDTREAFEQAISMILPAYDFDFLCLAGFMRVLTKSFTDAFSGRMINIHPSLLPAYKGLDTHARALADGATEAGCSVHYVAADVDSGEIIVQRKVLVLAGDTPDTLAERVLAQEHLAYPEAIEKLAQNM